MAEETRLYRQFASPEAVDEFVADMARLAKLIEAEWQRKWRDLGLEPSKKKNIRRAA